MNATTVYEYAKRMMACLDENDRALIQKFVDHNDRLDRVVTTIPAILTSMILDARAEIAAQEAKASKNTSALKAAQEILKFSSTSHTRPVLWYAHTSENGIQYVCDGFRILAMKEPVSLPELPSDITPMDFEKFIPVTHGEELPLPDLAELNAYIKTHKRKKGDPRLSYYFGDTMPLVDAVFLSNMMSAYPYVKAYVPRVQSKAVNVKAIYLEYRKEADDFDTVAYGVLLPISTPKNGEFDFPAEPTNLKA